MAAVPDKAGTVPPEGTTSPQRRRETSDYLTRRLDAEVIDIAPLR